MEAAQDVEARPDCGKDPRRTAVGDVVLGGGVVENALVVRPREIPRRTEEGTEDLPWGGDDFETLRIDSRLGRGKAIDSRKRCLRPWREKSESQAAADRMNWLGE